MRGSDVRYQCAKMAILPCLACLLLFRAVMVARYALVRRAAVGEQRRTSERQQARKTLLSTTETQIPRYTLTAGASDTRRGWWRADIVAKERLGDAVIAEVRPSSSNWLPAQTAASVGPTHFDRAAPTDAFHSAVDTPRASIVGAEGHSRSRQHGWRDCRECRRAWRGKS